MALTLCDLSGKRALITGASQGAGFALAPGLAAARARAAAFAPAAGADAAIRCMLIAAGLSGKDQAALTELFKCPQKERLA